MKKTIYNRLQTFVLSGFVLFGSHILVDAQTKEKPISGTIVDAQGNPLKGVTVYNHKGKSVVSDSLGNFEIDARRELSLLFEKDNYNKKLIPVSEFTGQITLEESEPFASEDNLIKMGIITKYQREMTGAVSLISPKDHLTYDHTQYVRDYIQGMLLGVQGYDNIRGLGNALFVIDGVIGRNPDILNMDEIDQITVLKDANAIALYGNQAVNGVIIINTKRGQINKRIANVNIRYGIKEPLALPKYLESAEYMELYNEARVNDGLEPLFDADLIEKYRSGNNPYRYPNVDYFSDEYLRSYTSRTDIVSEFSGGNERSQFYVNMGWNYDQSLIKLNPDVNAGANRFNIRGNIDFKINDFISSSLDAVAIVSNEKSALTNWFANASSIKPNAFAPLLPVSMMVDTSIAGTMKNQIEAANIFDGMLLGTSQVYQEDSPIASTLAGGYQNSNFRSTQFNNSIDFNLDRIVKGLSARTYLSFDFYDAYNIFIQNDYQRYQPNWMGDSIVSLTSFGSIDRRSLVEEVSTDGFISRIGFYGLLNYKKSLNENHFINTTLLGYVNSQKQTGIIQADKNSHIGFQFSYIFRNKLFADFSSAYVHSIKLPEGNRGGFSPTLGLAYILSEENFMKSISFINFLKIKASAGIIKSDLGINSYFLYKETYTQGSWFSWAENAYNNTTRNISQGANDKLTFEDRVDLNIGIESLLLNSLQLELNYFRTNHDNQLTKLGAEYPSFYSEFSPYYNYNKDSYTGFELGANYLKTVNNFSFNAGFNLLYCISEVKKRSEIYNYDYQYRVGKPVDAFFGLVDDGFYSQDDFVINEGGNLVLKENLPVPAFGRVQPGDIKYIDQNEDGVIDANDEVFIGQWQQPWSFGINLKLTYKQLSLFVLGIAQTGGDGLLHSWGDNPLYDNYYWVDGTDKYSEIVLNRWTPETANTATYPRLSSISNRHNFRPSTFWLYDNSFFDIKRIQLTYELSDKICKKLNMKALSVNIAAVNLLRIAENKKYQQLNIGSQPQYRYFTLGLRTSL